MTPVDYTEFVTGLRGLALRYRGRKLDDDELDAYWSGLIQHRLEWLLQGMLLAPTFYPRFFPSTGEIIKAGQQAEQESARKRFVSPAMNDAIVQGEIFCTACDDTGFIITERDCTSLSPHYKPGSTRTYATPCSCRAHNSLYQAKRAREARQTQARRESQ